MGDLEWLGLGWDEGPNCGGPGAPYRQSERLELYQKHLQEMLDGGHAYEAWESPEELLALRKEAEAQKKSFVYRAQNYSEADLSRFQAEGRKPVLRCVGATEDVVFQDEVLGEIRVPAEDMDDFVIRKADGFPTYHFAVVVDDHHMGVSHVLRAQEHLKNTARHIQLYSQLGWAPPKHGHMPLIFSMGGGKMSKRDKAKAARLALRESGMERDAVAAAIGLSPEDLQRFMKKKNDDLGTALAIADAVGVQLPEIDVIDFRRSGYLPEALVNFLALLGWSPGDDREIMPWKELVEAFTLDRMGKTAAKFDREKLEWMNGMYIRAASVERIVSAMKDYSEFNEAHWNGESEALLTEIATLFRERATTIRSLDEQVAWIFHAPSAYGPQKSVKKFLLKNDGAGLAVLRETAGVLEEVTEWAATELETVLTAHCEAKLEGKLGAIAQPLRIALTGGPVSPPIFATLALLERGEVQRRIQACLDYFAE